MIVRSLLKVVLVPAFVLQLSGNCLAAEHAGPTADAVAHRLNLLKETYQLREENMNLETAIDEVLSACIPPEPDKVTACQTRRQQLIAWREDYKTRVMALSERMRLARQEMIETLRAQQALSVPSAVE